MQVIFKSLFNGFFINIEIFLITLALSMPLGLVVMFGSKSRIAPVRWFTRFFVWVMRGSPLMLQLIVVMYAPGLLFGIRVKSRLTAALIAFTLNYAAYFSEIYRGGIDSVPLGQYEACKVLGMTRAQTFFKVILLQVIKRITPAMGNEVITLAKDTALARIIGVSEIIMSSESFTKQGLIWPLFSTGVFFLVFNGVLTFLCEKAERKMDYFRV